MKKTFFSMLVFFGTLALCFAHGKGENSARLATGGVLNAKQRAIGILAACTANGDRDTLKSALNEGFDSGLTLNEARETAVQLYAYCGFPRALNALSAIEQMVNDRQSAGKTTARGRDNTPFPADKTSYEIGSANQYALFGMAQGEPLTRDAPSDQIINYYLRAHDFGDIYGRDILDWKTREFLLVAALSMLPGCEAQLGAHIWASLRNGNSEDEIRALLALITEKVSKDDGKRAQDVFKSTLERRNR
jgi:alkylhydroperoxidase/carboxymuconolactone decarboxylase family protein YurZ